MALDGLFCVVHLWYNKIQIKCILLLAGDICRDYKVASEEMEMLSWGEWNIEIVYRIISALEQLDLKYFLYYAW